MPTTFRGQLLRAAIRFGGGHFKAGRRLRVGSGVEIHCRSGKVVLGDNVILHRGAMLRTRTGYIAIGDNVSVNPYSILDAFGGITIGNDVRIAAHVMITAGDHGYADPDVPIRLQPISGKSILIEDDVWIGGGAQILGGAHIARGCIIGAGAVVKGETEPFTVYAGVPARPIKRRG